MSAIRKKAIEGLVLGDTFSISRIFDEQDVIGFAKVSRDYNPVHFDERFAKAKNFDRCICHGLLVAGLLTEIGGQIGWLASGMNVRFVKPVYCGERVRCDFTITDIDKRGRATAQVIFTNEDGLTVSEAELTGILPGEEEKRIMKEILAEEDS